MIAAWEFYEKNKAEIGWDMTVLNPPFVFGVRLSFSPVFLSRPLLFSMRLTVYLRSFREQPPNSRSCLTDLPQHLHATTLRRRRRRKTLQ